MSDLESCEKFVMEALQRVTARKVSPEAALIYVPATATGAAARPIRERDGAVGRRGSDQLRPPALRRL
ncbi:hypothetical protein BHE74_00021128 [Ensete ventricosum]|nr:hypothetical protein BHE74_00021128 [Ensete ventricosum]